MMKLIECDIKDEKTRVSESTIRCLETALGAARNGEIDEVMVISTLSDGDLNIAFSDQPNVSTVVGRLEVLKFDLLRDSFSDADE